MVAYALYLMNVWRKRFLRTYGGRCIMALIKCPECGKEVSDKAEVCIHCGYPIKDFILSDIENVLSKINLCLNNIKIKNEMLNNFEQEYDKLKEYIEIFSGINHPEEKIIEFNSRLLTMLYEYVENIVYYFTPEESYDLFSLVDFSKISDNIQNVFVEKIDNLLTKDGAFDNNSISSQSYIILWYPLFETIKNFNQDNIDFLYSKICEKTQKQKEMNFPSIMEYISTTARKHVFMRRISEQINFNNASQIINIPKCPTCSSTNIHKIYASRKLMGAVGFGLLSKTAKSQFECKNCGYKW